MSRGAGTNRRGFLRNSALGAGALWTLSLEHFMARGAEGAPLTPSPYGPIGPKNDQATGLPLLQLPDGFRYVSYSWTGDLMSDGVRCPSLHDGMAVVAELDDKHDNNGRSAENNGRSQEHQDGRSGRLLLIRNHEQDVGTPYLNRPAITFRSDGAGGTTNLIFDTNRGQWESAWASLAGTVRNCAGGVTPWGTWITCEETGAAGHGWSFEVGQQYGSPVPLVDMGRMSHEALMVDPRTGYVYETEDNGSDSGFYKFVPHRRGRLADGGLLYMLAVKGQLNTPLALAYPLGTTWDVEWVRVDDPTASAVSTFQQGYLKGGARFNRLEGAWWGDRTGYFLSTNGGSAGEGQVFEYDPRRERLKLIYDAPNANEVDNPDNLTVTPGGSLLMCEDAAGNNFTAGERLIGLTLNGETFTFAQNNINLTAAQISGATKTIAPGDNRQSEWAGATFSPDGRWLFVNIQTPGITFAITGPWEQGPL